MESGTDVRTQLRSLSIPKERRPTSNAAPRSGARGMWLVVILLVALGAAATGYLGQDRIRAVLPNLKAAEPIRTLTVTATREASASAVLTATGKIVSDHKVQVATKVSGQVVALHFEQGDRVERGFVLARIEDVLYRARRNEAAARLEKSKANLAFQRVNFERVSSLVRGESAQPIEFADAERWMQDAEAQVAADQAALEFAQKSLNDTEVTAPISGVVLTRNVEVGDFVAAEGGRGANANAQFAMIADMRKLRVEVDVSELDIARITVNMPCVITPDAYKDRRYQGYVLWIDPGANYSKATVQVKVRIENPDDFLRVEGSAQVSFLTEPAKPDAALQQPPAIWIPAAAVRQGGQRTAPSVFVAVEGRWGVRAVQVGRKGDKQVEITSGLSEGQTIAVENLDRIVEGQAVAPQ